MFKKRSRLLIALVLFSVLGLSPGVARADGITLSYASANPVPNSPHDVGQDAGEPDRPDYSPPPRVSMMAGGRGSEPVARVETRKLVSVSEMLRWTWVVWMARYLNLNP